MIHTSWTISTLSSLPDHPHAPLTHKKKGKKSFRVAVGGAKGCFKESTWLCALCTAWLSARGWKQDEVICNLTAPDLSFAAIST